MKHYLSSNEIMSIGTLEPAYLQFGNIKIHCKTGEGLSENISEDAQQFWNHIKEYVIGK